MGRTIGQRGRFRRNLALCLCLVLFFSLIYLQKFAIPLGSTPISLLLAIQIAAAVYLVVYSHAVIDISGLLTFLAFTCLCLLGQAQSPRVSWPSLLQLIALNATLIVVARVPPTFYKKVLHLFHELMIVPAVIVFAQRLLLSAGRGDLINMENLLPHSIMLPGYTYAVEFGFGTGVIRPNGFFFSSRRSPRDSWRRRQSWTLWPSAASNGRPFLDARAWRHTDRRALSCWGSSPFAGFLATRRSSLPHSLSPGSPL